MSHISPFLKLPEPVHNLREEGSWQGLGVGLGADIAIANVLESELKLSQFE